MKRYEQDYTAVPLKESDTGGWILYSDASHEIDKRDARIDAEINLNANLMSQLSDEELRNIKLENTIISLKAETQEIIDDLEDKRRYEVSELEKMIKELDWHPIETAPRDGTPVDLWHKCGTRFIEQWWTDDNCWTCLFGDDEFTHWKKVTMPEI